MGEVRETSIYGSSDPLSDFDFLVQGNGTKIANRREREKKKSKDPNTNGQKFPSQVSKLEHSLFAAHAAQSPVDGDMLIEFILVTCLLHPNRSTSSLSQFKG